MKRTALFFLTSLRLSLAYHLGFFVPIVEKTDLYTDYDNTKSGQNYAHALTIAIDDVNNDPNILPGHNLTYSWTNSSDNNEVLREMYKSYISPNGEKAKVDVFIGPAFGCIAPAKVAQGFNIPMISYLCSERGNFNKNEYPLFVQTFQNTNTQAAATLFALLDSREWSRIGVLYEEAEPFWKDFEIAIGKRDSVHVVESVMIPKLKKFQRFGEFFLAKPEWQERNESLAIVRDALTVMKNKDIKIFVLLTSVDVLIEVMSQAYDLGLTGKSNPHRAFIGFQLQMALSRDIPTTRDLFRSLLAPDTEEVMFRTKKAARSLLLISHDKPRNTELFQRFKNELINRTEYVQPFKSSATYDFGTHDTSIPDVATALYDAVYQYALVLDRLNRRGVNFTARDVVEEFRRKPYISISGYESAFANKTGIVKVHLSLLQITKEITRDNMKTSHVETIGQFNYISNTEEITLELNSGKISWPWGTEDPHDERNCADDGFNCPEKEVNVAQSVVPVVISVVFVVIFLVLITLFLRQWKRERELKRSVWQIDINEIIFDRKISTDSKFSDDSGIRTSMQDLECLQLIDDKDNKDFFSNNNSIVEECAEMLSLESFSAVRSISGSYKSNRVFVKILPRNVDISKPMQRELRMLRHIHHENLNPFIGLGCENSYIWIVMQLGSKGTLEEVLANPDITLDHRFILSLVYDIAKGMTFLHNSDIKSHGNLKSSNCVVDNRWVLKITDYGIPDIRSRQARFMGPNNQDKKFRDLLWKAPELLREADPPLCGTKKGDVYSFAIILEEFHTLKSPYSNSDIPARAIVDRIVDGELPPYRPIVTFSIENAERLQGVMKDCWREAPEKRPSFQEIKYEVEGAMTRCGLKTDICDNMITLLENYSNELEHVVSQRTRQLRDEKQKTDALLDRMLPRSVAEQLKRGENVQAESFSSVTVYFSDIVQFTALCAESTPMQVVDMLNDLYLLFDDIIMDYNVYKVETIGDAYMVVSGLPMKNGKLHASEISCMALDILDSVKKFKIGHKPEHELQIRIGIHTGPVVAGVVGMTMPRYCLFGDTVNTASRMESNGKELQIHVSGSTKEILDELGGFSLEKREGEVYLKGKGNCITYWLQGASPDVPRCPRKLSKKAMKPLFQQSDSRKYSQPFRARKKTQISFPRASVA